ncbi:ABC transporter ATP-binding protein [Bifidobacterium apousia]|uniref:ABC transporter ATP-binding protein n=1 Tax=Bifidobacterium apousia TaxID=2750996 RepID=UPI0018DD5892|nr:ABC transporter ATP-binding protein [Bifidobacterium apousia]MBI0062607.1 ABC transporter ATP-binding protein [Bifidobacterium apousia]
MNAAIELGNLVKEYETPAGVIKALDHLDLIVPEGGIFGLLGPNGAGKSTTLEIAVGLRKPTFGTVSIFGRNPQTDSQWIHQRVSIQPQESTIFPQERVGEILSFWASLYDHPRDVDQVANWMGLDELLLRKVAKLSGGQKQRLNVGLSIIGRTKLAILDEPSTGLDVMARDDLWKVLRFLAEEGTTIVLSTHDLDEARVLCHEVAVIDHGRSVAQGSPEELIRKHAKGTLISCQVTPDGISDLVSMLRTFGEPEVIDKTTISIRADDTDPVIAVLSSNPAVSQLRMNEPSLYDAFVKLTGHDFE